VTLVTLLGLRTPFAIAALVAAALAQIGEFSFILTGLAVKDGLLPSEGRDLVLAASLLTIVASPFVFRAAETLGSRVEELPRVRGWQAGRTVARARAEIPPLSHHAIVVGHGRVGSVVAAALRQQGVPYVVVEQNLALARGLRREGVPVVYGDAGWPEVLVAAHPESARLLVIAIPEGGQVRRIVQTAREANPHLRVIVRTHSDAEAEWLHAQAIERVVMSERRTAMEIAEHAIKSFEEIVQAPPPGGPAAAAGRAPSDRREPGTTKTARTRS
jgi:CPA2 family monovalent cation:H+ antiporter-2